MQRAHYEPFAWWLTGERMRDRAGAILRRSNCASENADEVKPQRCIPGCSTDQRMPSKNTARWGEGKAAKRGWCWRLCCFRAVGNLG